MEQRRYPGHNHWFYESQTSPRTSQAAPLVPEAAHIDDRFLLFDKRLKLMRAGTQPIDVK